MLIQNCPMTEISNEYMKAKLYLPDAQNGYYRATRFDWSGVIYALEYKKHSYFSEWFENHDPFIHDAICGPVDEFTQIGYEESLIGGEFLKIGVGLLRKPEESRYDRFKLYEIVDGGKWGISEKKDSVVFSHLLESKIYAYDYTKTIKITAGKPKLSIKYSLENMGKQPITTYVYNHNFFTIDRQITGPNIVVSCSFEPKGKWRDENSPVTIKRDKIHFLRDFRKGETIFMENMSGFSSDKDNYYFAIENLRSKAGVKIMGNQKLARVVFWASSTTSCPEPYIFIRINPNEKFTWKNEYEFYEF